MGWVKPSPWEAEQLVFPCRTCQARVDEWCFTRSGRPAQMLHADRYHQALKFKRQQRRNR